MCVVGPSIHDDGRPYYRFAGAEGKVWLMPVDSTLRHTAVKMYAPYSLKGRLFKALMYLGLVGSKVSIEEESLAELEQALADALGEEAVRLAFYNPVLPDRRILLIMKPEGGIVAYARMAGTDRARRVLEHEEYILGLLRAVPALKQHVPKPLAFLMHDNATVLITSAGPGPKGPSVWTPLHSDFSRKLYEAFKKDEMLAESKLWQIVMSSIESYQPHLTEAWRLRYKLALEKLEPYKNTVIPNSLAHRDFTPWNTQIGPERVFAFDWEFARENYLPNYDYFHFHYVTSTNVSHDVSAEKARGWIEAAPIKTAVDSSVLFLAYLLDIATFYQRGIDQETFEESGIASEAGKLIDELDAWFRG